MGCNCKMTESILAILILVFTYWEVPNSGVVSLAIVTISAALLLIHSFACKNCSMCVEHGEMMSKKKKRR